VVAIGWGITREELVYRPTPQGELTITIFYSDGWKPTNARPSVVLFFGGGFVNGSTRQFYS